MSVTLQRDINSFLNFEHALRDEMSWMAVHVILNSSRSVSAETAEMSDTCMSNELLCLSDMFSVTRAVHAAMGDMSFPTTHTDRSTNLGNVGRSEMSVTMQQPIICRVSKLVHAVRDEMSLIFTDFEISKWRRLVSVEIDEMSLKLKIIVSFSFAKACKLERGEMSRSLSHWNKLRVVMLVHAVLLHRSLIFEPVSLTETRLVHVERHEKSGFTEPQSISFSRLRFVHAARADMSVIP